MQKHMNLPDEYFCSVLNVSCIDSTFHAVYV